MPSLERMELSRKAVSGTLLILLLLSMLTLAFNIHLTESSNSIAYHNNFVDNKQQVYDGAWYYPNLVPSIIAWDDGYPFGGNYWSHCTDVDLNNDDIWDHPYVIDENNRDRYPLVNPWIMLMDDFSTDSGMWRFVESVVNINTGEKYPGSAYRDSDAKYMVLTENRNHQAGVIWLNQDIFSPFTVEFKYKAGGGTGADGLVFMFYKQKNYDPYDGGGLGFVTPPGGPSSPTAVPGYGIEFDNYNNGFNGGSGEFEDPSGNHIALIKDSMSNHLIYKDDQRTEDNQWHAVKIVISDSTVEVYVDNESVLTWKGTIDRTYGGLGFSAATASRNNWHIIDDVKITVGPAPTRFILVPSEGWQNKELFVATWRRSTEYPGKIMFEIFNRRDMWYLIRVYEKMPDGTWLEIVPDEFLRKTGPYLGPYSVKSFLFPENLIEGDQIKIEVRNDLNDNALCALWSLDLAVRALLGVSISPSITNWESLKTKLLTFYNSYLEAIGNLRLGNWKLGLLQLCKALVGSAAAREFADLIKEVGIETAAAKIATAAFKLVSMIFWLIPNVPVWLDLFKNANKEPFVEDVTFTVKGTGTELPALKVIDGLTIIQGGPYFVGETIEVQFIIKSEDASPVTLYVLTVGGQGPRKDAQDFTFKTNITINPGESYNYKGRLKLLHNGTYHFFIAYQTIDGEWVTVVPVDAGAFNSLDINVLVPETLVGAELCSPGELRVYDDQGRVTGLVNKEEKMEIPRSFYFDGIVVIYDPNDSYKYQVKGISEGEYNVTIGRCVLENLTLFEAEQIPISNNSLHQYACDWDTLSLNGEGVMVWEDSDGDTLFEKTFTSNSKLTTEEFMFPAKATFAFNALWEGVNYQVVFSSCNSTISAFNFYQSLKQISFKVSGKTGTSGYCNVTIPKNLLKGEPWTVRLNGTDVIFTATQNETHSFIYFTYTHASTYEVIIQGTWVIPEFSSATILLLFMLTTLIAIVLLRRKRKIL